MSFGSIIFLNGTSGAGKTSLAIEMQKKFNVPFWRISSDQFIEAKLLPKRDFEGGTFEWTFMRPYFFRAFHHCIPAIASAGNNVLVDHIIEDISWIKELQKLLHGFDLFFVGVHCHREELFKREKVRIRENKALQRFIGEAREHLKTHDFCHYDFEVDTTRISIEENASKIIEVWEKRKAISSFFTT